MKIADGLVIYEVVVKQNLRAFLDISAIGGYCLYYPSNILKNGAQFWRPFLKII